jgi:hypothetical protein
LGNWIKIKREKHKTFEFIIVHYLKYTVLVVKMGIIITVLQENFSNREIAYMFWSIPVVIWLIALNSGRKFIKEIIQILVCRKIITFIIVLLLYIKVSIEILQYLGLWDSLLLKDTILWVIFVELPIFYNAIQKAKDRRFFAGIIKQNVQIAVIISFLGDFWVFSLVWEIILIPIIIFCSLLYVMTNREKVYYRVKILFDKISTIAGLYFLGYLIYNTVLKYSEIFNIETLKQFLLPFELIVLNMPIFYGLSIYNYYEQLIIHMKGNLKERKKMKWLLVKFAGFNLYKLSMIREYGMDIFVRSLNVNDFSEELNEFQCFLEGRIGDIYMNRSKLYLFGSLSSVIISLIIIITCNSNVSLKDLIMFNFVLDMYKIKEIVSQISIVSLVLGCFAVFMAIGFRQQKYEDLTKVKKIAMLKFLSCLKTQISAIQDIDLMEQDCKELFNGIIMPGYNLYKEAVVIIKSYNNLINRWELEAIKQIEYCSGVILSNIHYDKIIFENISLEEFEKIYREKIKNSPQNEKINVFQSDLKRDLDKYKDSIIIAKEELKQLL